MKAASSGPAFLFDLDGTLVDTVYQHVLAWREALDAAKGEHLLDAPILEVVVVDVRLRPIGAGKEPRITPPIVRKGIKDVLRDRLWTPAETVPEDTLVIDRDANVAARGGHDEGSEGERERRRHPGRTERLMQRGARELHFNLRPVGPPATGPADHGHLRS